MGSKPQPNNSWWQKLGWLILIWATSVAALATGAWAIRLLIRAAGLAN
jgi:hypothetical protein